MDKTVCLDEEHSTTRLCHKLLDGSLLDEHGGVKEELKFKIDIPEFKIKNSRILGKPEDKFETMLFLPEGDGRQGEGGLRTKGFFKHSYKIVDSEWFIVDIDANPIMPAPAEIKEAIDHHLSTVDNSSSITSLPLITVVTVVLNGEKYLEETIQSVINQTYPNVEYIIIDGGSTDGTIDIIKKYEDYIDYWVSEKDRGIYDAMNKGVQLSIGDIVSLLNADDSFFSQKTLFACWALFSRNKFLVSDAIMVTSEGEKRFKVDKNRRLAWNIPFIHTATMIPLSIYKKIGLYDERYIIASDIEFFFRLKKFTFLEEIVFEPIVRMREGGMSSKMFVAGRKEYMKIYIDYVGKRLDAFIYFLISIIEEIAYRNKTIRSLYRTIRKNVIK